MGWSSRDVDRVLRRAGFALVRRGAHDLYARSGHPRTVSVPSDREQLPTGTLRSIWRQAGLTPEQADELR